MKNLLTTNNLGQEPTRQLRIYKQKRRFNKLKFKKKYGVNSK